MDKGGDIVDSTSMGANESATPPHPLPPRAMKTTTTIRIHCDGELLHGELDNGTRYREGRYEYGQLLGLGIWVRRYQLSNLEFGSWRTA